MAITVIWVGGGLRSRLMPNLPKSSKTFLGRSQAEYEVDEMENSKGEKGSFTYFGIANRLQRCVNEKLHRKGIIEIQAHADEMPKFVFRKMLQ